MAIGHVATPINHDLAQEVQISSEVERLFSVLINRLKISWDRKTYLWSDLDLRFVSFYKSNYILNAWFFRNHSNMLIYYQCWKQLCCLFFLFFIIGTCDTFLGSLINKKFKRTALIQNKDFFLTISIFAITVSINLTNPC